MPIKEFVVFKKIKLVQFITFYFIISTSILLGQNNKEKDTINFVYYPDKIMVRANLSTQTDAYEYRAKRVANLDLETNTNYKLFLSVDYKFIGFSYGFYPKFFGGNKDADSKGKSTFSDYNFRFFLVRWLQTVQFSKTKGYYVANTSDFVPDWNENTDPYLQFPDFKTVQYGASTSYIFNPKFSLKSITSFTEWQKKSAGSFIPAVEYTLKTITSKTDDLEGKQHEYDIRLAAGYFYNFIIHERFYIAPYLSPSLGVKFLEDKSVEFGTSSTTKETYFTRNIDGGLKIGYNTDRILFGASLNVKASSYNESKNTIVTNDKVYGLLYFGYRFGATNVVSKNVEKVTNKLNF